jgi:hypothetical protein
MSENELCVIAEKEYARESQLHARVTHGPGK